MIQRCLYDHCPFGIDFRSCEAKHMIFSRSVCKILTTNEQHTIGEIAQGLGVSNKIVSRKLKEAMEKLQARGEEIHAEVKELMT